LRTKPAAAAAQGEYHAAAAETLDLAAIEVRMREGHVVAIVKGAQLQQINLKSGRNLKRIKSRKK
jgi:translation initiation factor 1 (eIF-1/SUI1)